MRLDDVIAKVATTTGLPRPNVKKTVEAAFAAIKAAAESGEKVAVPGLGVFLMKDRAAGEVTGKDGTTRQVAASRQLAFRPLVTGRAKRKPGAKAAPA